MQRQRAEGELEVVRQQLLQAQVSVTEMREQSAAQGGRVEELQRQLEGERQRRNVLQTENLRLHQGAMAAEEAVEENQGLRERVAQMQARIRELEQQQQVRST